MESHGKILWELVNDPDRGTIKNDSTMAIDRGFLYIGIMLLEDQFNESPIKSKVA